VRRKKRRTAQEIRRSAGTIAVHRHRRARGGTKSARGVRRGGRDGKLTYASGKKRADPRGKE